MIVIHDPEQLASCHQTWICEVEIHLPDSDNVMVGTVRAEGLEEPLSTEAYCVLTEEALEVAIRGVRAMKPERKP